MVEPVVVSITLEDGFEFPPELVGLVPEDEFRADMKELMPPEFPRMGPTTGAAICRLIVFSVICCICSLGFCFICIVGYIALNIARRLAGHKVAARAFAKSDYQLNQDIEKLHHDKYTNKGIKLELQGNKVMITITKHVADDIESQSQKSEKLDSSESSVSENEDSSKGSAKNSNTNPKEGSAESSDSSEPSEEVSSVSNQGDNLEGAPGSSESSEEVSSVSDQGGNPEGASDSSEPSEDASPSESADSDDASSETD
eukprot:TRINITY_DN1938_c0_g1_i1.p1 TRINITY_DN1938_c0_g1~~TRINITY_DN1938_c0_g1_i1.p1  ORF type:complete len:257 (-),score=47.49 TRINITY_DN1938_c0_g1_i1:20-790(-)